MQDCNTLIATPKRRCHLRNLTLSLLLAGFSATALAQHPSGPSNADSDLPDAPGHASTSDSFQAPEPQGTANISGVVLDIHEGMVPGAQITLETPSGTVERTETSDSAGAFLFKNVPAGGYKVRIVSPGLESFVSNEINLHSGEHHQLPRIALPIATSTSDVTVTATQDQIATEQIHAQIQQRAFGVFPNFYTSYLWNPAPLRSKHKFYLAFRSTTDPINFLSPAIVASIQQARGTYKGYGDGIEGFAKRYGADYGNVVIGRFIGAAILPSLFHQDPRYFYQGSGTTTARTVHAVGSTFITRGDNGRTQPNFSYLLGISAAAAITNLYYPDNNRTVGTVVANVFLRIGVHSAGNIVREFLSRRVTTKVPDYAQGKPVADAAAKPEAVAQPEAVDKPDAKPTP